MVLKNNFIYQWLVVGFVSNLLEMEFCELRMAVNESSHW